MFIYVNVYIKNNFNLVIFLINVFKCFGKKKKKFMICLIELNFNKVYDYDFKCCLKNKVIFKNLVFCKFLI